MTTFCFALQNKYPTSVVALKEVLLILSGATVAVSEGRAIGDSDHPMPLGDISATFSVPATPGESMAASASRKRSASEQEAGQERLVKKRVVLEPDSDEDIIVLSQPGTLTHEVADNQPTSTIAVGHHIMSHMGNACICLCMEVSIFFCSILVPNRIHLSRQRSFLCFASMLMFYRGHPCSSLLDILPMLLPSR